MKLLEVLKSNVGIKTLNENDKFIVEMANFLADVTDLPANIVLWTQPQPNELPHNKYRMKVYKDRVHAATFTIGSDPVPVWGVRNPKFQLNGAEESEVKSVISRYSTLFIQLVDDKLSGDDVKQEIKRIRGQM